MKVGFTGTQQGMSAAQQITLRELIKAVGLRWTEFHHGDCIGADEEAHMLVSKCLPDCLIVVHPPESSLKRAWCQTNPPIQPKPYLERNEDIVRACELLIATPKTHQEVLRSGTWATVRCAKKLKKDIWLILPDGSLARTNA